MKVYLASDHAGFLLKEKILSFLMENNYEVEDVGSKELDPQDDYPQFAHRAAIKLLGSDDADAKAIIVCGSGQGMAIAANRHKGVRASVVWSVETAEETREDNDSNVLCLASRFIDAEESERIVEAWLNTPFSNAPRHKRRIDEIEELSGN